MKILHNLWRKKRQNTAVTPEMIIDHAQPHPIIVYCLAKYNCNTVMYLIQWFVVHCQLEVDKGKLTAVANLENNYS